MNPDTSPLEPSAELLDAARRWLSPVRAALGPGFVSAYVTGSVLTRGFDPAHSHINLLVIARSLEPDVLDGIAAAAPDPRRKPQVDSLFMAQEQVRASLDVFPIEWLDLIERHLLLEGEDVLAGLEVPLTNLRLQCEHELRAKHLRLRHEYLASAKRGERLAEVLVRMASGFHTLFRTLLRLHGEVPPPNTERVVERVAALFSLDATALLGAHAVRYSAGKPDARQARERYRRFLVEIERLASAIDGLRVP
jgi:hypothetical protein